VQNITKLSTIFANTLIYGQRRNGLTKLAQS